MAASLRGYNPSIEALPPEAQNAKRPQRGYLVAALADLVRRSEAQAALSDMLFLLVISLPLILTVVLQMAVLASRSGFGPWQNLLAAVPPEFMPWIWLVTASWFMLAGASSLLWARGLRLALRRQLEESSLPQGLAAGLIEPGLIAEYTPIPWRLLLPRGTGLAHDLWRIAANLDWYIAPPRRLWRWQWIYHSILLCITLAGCGLSIIAPLSAALLGGAMFLLLLPACFLQQRRRIWAEELARELRRRLDN